MHIKSVLYIYLLQQQLWYPRVYFLSLFGDTPIERMDQHLLAGARNRLHLHIFISICAIPF